MSSQPNSPQTVVLEAPVLIDRSLKLIRDGRVIVRQGRTVAAGSRKEIPMRSRALVLRLKDQILMPGLVNAHCHLDYTAMQGLIPAEGGFSAWIGRIMAAKRQWNDADYLRSIQQGLEDSLRRGTTLLANITCVPHLVSSLDFGSTPRLWWFAEEIDVGRAAVEPERAHWLKPRFPRQQFSFSPHAPYSVTPGRFAQVVDFCGRHRLPWTSHVAESSEEWEMFADARGPLFELLQKAGRDMSDCGGATPLGRLLQLGCGARSPALLAHANCLSDGDLAALQARSITVSVVHCPRSHDFFGHPEFRLNELRRAGVPICLGTDSLASNDDLSMFSEMRTLKEKFPDLEPPEVVKMATSEGARALGESENWLNWADWIAIPASAKPFESIIEFADRPPFVMMDGKITNSP